MKEKELLIKGNEYFVDFAKKNKELNNSLLFQKRKYRLQT